MIWDRWIPPDPRFAEHYKDPEKSNLVQAYATLIEGMDKSLGDLMDHLEAKGVADHALIIFLGDNDDHRHEWMGHKNSLLLTPNLDRLAGQGWSFPNAFVNAGVCSPSRAPFSPANTYIRHPHPILHRITIHSCEPKGCFSTAEKAGVQNRIHRQVSSG